LNFILDARSIAGSLAFAYFGAVILQFSAEKKQFQSHPGKCHIVPY